MPHLDHLILGACSPPELPPALRRLVASLPGPPDGQPASPAHTEPFVAYARDLGCPSSRVEDAAAALGPWRTAALSFALECRTWFSPALPGYGLAADALWDHALAALVAHDHVGRELNQPDGDSGLVASFLHDAGMVIVDSAVGPRFLRCVRDSIRAERATLGIHHAWLGGLVARTWRLRWGIATGIVYHHDPWQAPTRATRRMATRVALADAVACAIGFGDGAAGSQLPWLLRHSPLSADGVRRVFGATERTLETLRPTLP